MPEPSRLPAAREHQLTGQINPRCVRCKRTLLDIIRHPGIACRAGFLPFEAPPPDKDKWASPR